MTTITIFQSKGSYKRILLQGHAGFAAYGRDIVCASISVLTINTINSLEKLAHQKMAVNTDEKSGKIDCSFEEEMTEQGRLLMDSLVLGLKEIQKQYGKKYLALIVKEV